LRKAVFAVLLLLALPLMLQVVYADNSIVAVDSFGRVVEIPEKPMKIVSLAPSITETLFAMELGDRVIGVTSFCNYPSQVPKLVEEGKLQVVGGFTNPSLEKIVALDPDLVFAHNLLSPEFVKKLEDLGIPVVVIKTPESIEGVYQMIFLIGRACGEDEKAASLIESLVLKIQEWSQRVSGAEKVDAVYIVSYGPIWVAGSGTYVDDLIKLAGGENAFSDKSWWASISEEELVAKDPKILITSDEHVYEALRDLKSKGLIHGKIRLVSSDPIARPGPRIAYALEDLIKAIHPEVWNKTIEVAEIEAPAQASITEPIRITVKVVNPGLIEGEKTVELKFGDETYTKQVYLKPGETRAVTFTISPQKAGVYLIEVGEEYAICDVRKPSEEEIRLALQSVLRELESISSAENSLTSSINQLSSAINNQLSSTNNAIAELKTYIMTLVAVSVITLIIAVSAAALAAKSRR